MILTPITNKQYKKQYKTGFEKSVGSVFAKNQRDETSSFKWFSSEGVKEELDKFNSLLKQKETLSFSDFSEDNIEAVSERLNILNDQIKQTKTNTSQLGLFFQSLGSDVKEVSESDYKDFLSASVAPYTQDKQGMKLLIEEFHAMREEAIESQEISGEDNSLSEKQQEFAEAIKATNEEFGSWLEQNPTGTWKQYAGQMALTTIKTKALALATTALNTALSAGISLLATAVINIASAAIDEMIFTTEEATELLEEATTRYKELNEQVEANTTFAEENVKTYEKLSKGVDNFGRNLTLTDEEFAEYNSLSNQIAEKFPSLIQGYTDTGVAILSCSDNVKVLNDALAETNKALQNEILLNGLDILKSYDKLYTGGGTQETFDALSTVLDGDTIDRNAFEEAGITKGELKDILTNAGVSDVSGGWDTLIEEFNNHIGEIKIYRKSLLSEIDGLNADLQNQVILPYLMYDDDYSQVYKTLTDEQKALIQNLLRNINLTDIMDESIGTDLDSIMGWINDNIISPIGTEGNTEFKNALQNLFTADKNFEEMPFKDYLDLLNESIDSAAKTLAGADNEKLVSALSQYEDALYSYTTGTYEGSVEEAQQAIANVEAQLKELMGEDTFSDIFGALTYEMKYWALTDTTGTLSSFSPDMIKDIGSASILEQVKERLNDAYAADEKAEEFVKLKDSITAKIFTDELQHSVSKNKENGAKGVLQGIWEGVGNQGNRLEGLESYLNKLTPSDLAILEQNIPMDFIPSTDSDELRKQLQRIIDRAKQKLEAEIGFDITAYADDYSKAKEQVDKYQSIYNSLLDGALNDSEKLELTMETPELLPYINDLDKLKTKIESLAQESTVGLLDDLNAQLAEMQENPFVDPNDIQNVQTMISLVKSLAFEVSNLSPGEAINRVKSGYTTVTGLEEEHNENGIISSDTLSSLSELSEDLKKEVVSYINGDSGYTELLAEAKEYYEQLKTDNIESLITINDDFIKFAKDAYNVDLQNCMTYAEAKNKILNGVIIAENPNGGNYHLSDFYDINTGEYTELYISMAKTNSDIIGIVANYVQTLRNGLDMATEGVDYEQFFIDLEKTFASGTSTDKHMEQFNKAMRDIKHQYNLGNVSAEEYWKAYESATETYLAGCTECIDDYYANIESLQQGWMSVIDEGYSRSKELLSQLYEDHRIDAEEYYNELERLNEQSYGPETKYGHIDSVQQTYLSNQREIDTNKARAIFDEEVTKLDWALERGEILRTHYTTEYTKLWEKYYKGKEQFRDEDYEAERAIAQQIKDNIQYQIDGLQAYIDTNTDTIQMQIDAIEANTADIEDMYQTEIDKIQSQIDLIQDKADEEDRFLRIKEAELALEKASQRTRKVYATDGRVEYRQDPEAIKNAKTTYDDAVRDVAVGRLEAEIKRLEAERDGKVKANDQKVEGLNTELDTINAPIETLIKVLESNLAEQYQIDSGFIGQLLKSTDSTTALTTINAFNKANGLREWTMEDLAAAADFVKQDTIPTQTQSEREEEQRNIVTKSDQINADDEALGVYDKVEGDVVVTDELHTLNGHLEHLISIINTYSVPSISSISPSLLPVTTSNQTGVNSINTNNQMSDYGVTIGNVTITVTTSATDGKTIGQDIATEFSNAILRRTYTNLKK